MRAELQREDPNAALRQRPRRLSGVRADLQDRRPGSQSGESHGVVEDGVGRDRSSAVIGVGICIEAPPERVSLARLPRFRRSRAHAHQTDPERRDRDVLQRMGGTTAGRAGSVRRPWRAEAFRSRSWVQGCRVCSDAGADPDAPFELDGITEGALVDIGFGRSHHVDEAPMETHTSHAEVLVEADRPVVGVGRDQPGP